MILSETTGSFLERQERRIDLTDENTAAVGERVPTPDYR